MAADDVRRCRANLRKSGLKKVEVWVPEDAAPHLKAIEAVLRGKKGDDALSARVLARLALTGDLIAAALAPANSVSFSPDAAKAAMAHLVKAR